MQAQPALDRVPLGPGIFERRVDRGERRLARFIEPLALWRRPHQPGGAFQQPTIARKAEWPRWTPTPAMIKREPQRYGPVAGGLPGGAGNPLGPRALYLYRDGRDTLYRLHGTTEPHTIGTMVSSGCVRFLNQDIIDLYGRVPVGTRAVVLTAGGSAAS